MMDRETALRKSIHVFEGLRRMLSKSENGFLPDKGCADTFQAIDETVQALKEMLREMQSSQTAADKELKKYHQEYSEERELREWQREIMESGTPERLDLR